MARTQPDQTLRPHDTGASPFHAGEQEVQTRLGVREEIEPWARRVVRPFLPEDHRAFFAALPFVVLGARDNAGRPWATLLGGAPGFVRSPDPRHLRISTRPTAGDALGHALRAGDDVGILGIELHTRRRNRVNGHVVDHGDTGFALRVGQSFGNCPQYITERRWTRAPVDGEVPTTGTRSPALSEPQRRAIEAADTFFVASGHRRHGDGEVYGMDVSHRGGAPGFVQVENPRELLFPDYAGNNHFNTIGNLVVDPRAGLLFVDFERGDTLQLTGHAEIVWDGPELKRFAGARRLLRFRIDEVVGLENAVPIRWAKTGDARREMRIVEKRRESADVTSFFLETRDGGDIPDFSAGQYLPIVLDLPGEEPARRTYSLSSPPGEPSYRITVKRDPLGRVSRHLHDRVEVGDILLAGAPHGDFTLHPGSLGALVLVSAGVGLTPLVSMLRAALEQTPLRPIWFVHGARDGDHHPLKLEVAQLADTAPNLRVHVAYSRPRAADQQGRDFDRVGRVDAAVLETLVPSLDAEFFLCGPLAFMAAIEAQLEMRGVSTERVHSESFGPCA